MIPDFSKARIAVVGDAMIDRWIYGRVERISPEAPIPVFVHERTVETPGGAANVAENLKALGCGDVMLRNNGHDTVKTRFVAGGVQQQLMRYDLEEAKPVSKFDADNIIADVASFEPNVLVLSDYGKGVFNGPVNLADCLTSLAAINDIKVIVDPKGKDWSKYRGADVVTPNLKEWFDVQSSFDGIGAVLLTRGAEGMSLIRHSQDRLDIPATNRSAVDVCGAGDTVVAALAACLAVGMDLVAAAHMANYAAGVVVGKRGTAVCTRAELEEACLKGE